MFESIGADPDELDVADSPSTLVTVSIAEAKTLSAEQIEKVSVRDKESPVGDREGLSCGDENSLPLKPVRYSNNKINKIKIGPTNDMWKTTKRKETHRTTEGLVSISRLKKKRGGGRERKAEGFAYVTKKIYLIPT